MAFYRQILPLPYFSKSTLFVFQGTGFHSDLNVYPQKAMYLLLQRCNNVAHDFLENSSRV